MIDRQKIDKQKLLEYLDENKEIAERWLKSPVIDRYIEGRRDQLIWFIHDIAKGDFDLTEEDGE